MAEVKVKITAQNEVRTGLQQALQETQKFSQQAKAAVSNTMTINPFAGDDRLGPLRELQQQARALRESARAPIEPVAVPSQAGNDFATTSARGSAAIRGLAIDLANATSPAQVFEAVIKRISTAFGGLVAATAGFAIGSVIRRSLEDAAAGLNDLTDRGTKLSETLLTLTAPTTSFQEFASTLGSVKSQIEALQKATEEYKSSVSNIAVDFATQRAGIAETLGQRFFGGLGQVAGRVIDRASGAQGALFNQADATEESRLSEARLSVRAAIAQQLQNEIALSQQTTEEGRKQLEIEQERLKKRKELQDLLRTAGASTQETNERLGEFDRLSAQIQNRPPIKPEEKTGTREGNVTGRQLGPGTIEGIREFERAQEAARRALGPEFGPGTADAAAGGFRVDAANFARQQAEEAAKQLSLNRFSGDFGASALQRIGGASEEFFRVRPDEQREQRRSNEYLKQLVDLIRKGEPLVLKGSQ
jgi:hypothetical protein